MPANMSRTRSARSAPAAAAGWSSSVEEMAGAMLTSRGAGRWNRGACPCRDAAPRAARPGLLGRARGVGRVVALDELAAARLRRRLLRLRALLVIDELDERHLRGVAAAPAELVDARVAARTLRVAGPERL